MLKFFLVNFFFLKKYRKWHIDDIDSIMEIY